MADGLGNVANNAVCIDFFLISKIDNSFVISLYYKSVNCSLMFATITWQSHSLTSCLNKCGYFCKEIVHILLINGFMVSIILNHNR